MKSSESIAALADALSKAQSEMTGAKKSAKNPFFKSTYPELSSVMEAIAKPFAEHGLSFVQSPGFVNTNGLDMVSVTTRIMHSSGEWMEGECLLPPTKADAQGFGSAITYAKRYGLQAMAGIPSVDDDGNAAVQAAAPKKNVNRVKAQAYTKELETMLEAEDGLGIRQLNDEIKDDETLWHHVWNYFTTAQKTKAKELMSQNKEEA